MKEFLKVKDVKLSFNNNEILNQNYITTSEFKDVFNITSHLDYLTINEIISNYFSRFQL